MAKASKEYGRKVLDGVEVFEVGKQQTVELLGPWADIDLVNARNRKIGFSTTCDMVLLYVVEGPLPRLYGEVGIVSWISSMQSLYEVLQAQRSYDELCGAIVHYEVWHIVDDGDLWREWTIEAAATGGDLQAAQMWNDVFHDDKYLRQIEDQYTGDYHVYDTTAGDWPGVCIADVTQHDLAHGYKYVFEHWSAAGELLKQCVEDNESASITCDEYRDGGRHVVGFDVASISTWEGLEVLRDDDTAPVWCPLRVCYVCWSEE